MYNVGASKNLLKNVLEMQRRGNQTDMCFLTSLGKYLLLSRAREDLKKAANPFRPHQATLSTLGG